MLEILSYNNPEFNLLIKDSKLLDQVLSLIKKVSQDYIIIITQKGLQFFIFHPSKISFLLITIPKSDLDEFEVQKEGIIYYSNNNLNKFMEKIANKIDSVRMSFKDDHFILQIRNIELNFIRNLELDFGKISENQPVPEAVNDLLNESFSNSFEIYDDWMKTILNDAKLYSELITINMLKDKILFETEGTMDKKSKNKNVKGKYIASIARLKLEDFIFQKEIKSHYSNKMLNDFIKTAGSLAKYFKVSFETERNIHLYYKFIDNGTIEYILAPRTEESSIEED